MNFEKYSTGGLHSLHEAVRISLAEDDTLPHGKKKFAVREQPDWKQWACAIEAELLRRGEHVAPLPW